MTLKDPFELPIKTLDRHRARLMQDAPHFDIGITMRIGMPLGMASSDQGALLLGIERVEFRVRIMLITQQEAEVNRQFTNEFRRMFVVSAIDKPANRRKRLTAAEYGLTTKL